MRHLTKYLYKQNLFYMSVIFGAATAIFILIELFDKLDYFLTAHSGIELILQYFIYRTPEIMGKIFPAIYFITIILQLGLMQRNREIIALESNAVSCRKLIKPFLIHASIVMIIFLVITETIGITGVRVSSKILSQDVKGRTQKNSTQNLWLYDNNAIIHVDTINFAAGTGNGLIAYNLKNMRPINILIGKKFTAKSGEWTVHNAIQISTTNFTVNNIKTITIPIKIKPTDLVAIKNTKTLELFTIPELTRMIKNLKSSGSNIESLETELYGRFSYAFALLILALIGFGLIIRVRNLYIALPIGIILVFIYYVMFVMGVTFGETGVLPPFIAVWLASFIFGILGLFFIYPIITKEK